VSDSPTPAVVARSLTKDYRLYESPAARILEWVTRRTRHRVHRALDDVSFEQPSGEGIAIIGENGAGKSTLLKLVAGVTLPTSGRIDVSGRIAAILELGSGFHPEFTGRQNIRLNAALLGLSEQEILQREPEIVSWSELGEFIDRPVREYSSGMTVRLGFSIATQVDPEILIVDEALSVGDGYFQKKSMDRMVRFVELGGTLLFCSHALYLISAFCERALWLRNGRVEAFGPTNDVIREYESYLLRRERDQAGERQEAPSLSAQVEKRRTLAHILDVRALDRSSKPPCWRSGETVRFEVTCVTDSVERPIHLGAHVETDDGKVIASLGSHSSGRGEPFSGATRYRVQLEVENLPLVKGSYNMSFLLLDEQGLHVYDRRILRPALLVESNHFESGLVRLAHRWILE